MTSEDDDSGPTTDTFKVWAASGGSSGTYKGRTGITLRRGRNGCTTALLSKFGPAATDEVRSRELKLASYAPDPKGPGYDFSAPTDSVTLRDAEIEAVLAFLREQIESPGRYHVIDTQSAVGELLSAIQSDGDVHTVLRNLRLEHHQR